MRTHLAPLITQLTLAIGLLATIPTQADPVPVVNSSGILTGVDDLVVVDLGYGVQLNPAGYDVTFVPGSCISVFNPCTSSANFTFTSAAGALDAISALEGVLRTSAFSNDPNDILGYSPTSAPPADPLAGELYILIPYEVDVSPYNLPYNDVLSISTNITLAQGVQFIGGVGWETNYDVSGDYANYSVYSVWKPVSVPEPSALSLFGAALITFAGFAMYRRRKQLDRWTGDVERCIDICGPMYAHPQAGQ